MGRLNFSLVLNGRAFAVQLQKYATTEMMHSEAIGEANVPQHGGDVRLPGLLKSFIKAIWHAED
eukprot:2758242-Alexandrium_andersonii.AAC.1